MKFGEAWRRSGVGSKDTLTRRLQDLRKKGVIVKHGDLYVADRRKVSSEVASLILKPIRDRYNQAIVPPVEVFFIDVRKNRKRMIIRPAPRVIERVAAESDRFMKSIQRILDRIDDGKRVRMGRLPKSIVRLENRLWARVPEGRAWEDVWRNPPPSIDILRYMAAKEAERSKQDFHEVFKRLINGKKLPRRLEPEKWIKQAKKNKHITADIGQRYLVQPRKESAAKRYTRRERERLLNYLWLAVNE